MQDGPRRKYTWGDSCTSDSPLILNKSFLRVLLLFFRIFLDGHPWIDGGVFRGMLTADGISKHMAWVAMEVRFGK